MDWLAVYHASINCFKKEVVFRMLNEVEFNFQSERDIVLICLILIGKTRKLLQKGCEGYLAHIVDTNKVEWLERCSSNKRMSCTRIYHYICSFIINC